MRIRVFDTAAQAGQAASLLIGAQLLRKPDSVLGLATGSTPIPLYRELIRLHQNGLLDFSHAVTFNLDEYAGLPPEHPQSYHNYMWEQLFEHVNLRPEAVHLPDGCAPDPAASAAAYDAAIRGAGGIDLQLLGIGHNAHIGFNEPGDRFLRECRLVDLSDATIAANARFFASEAEVPRQAVSLGIGGILEAKQILLLAFGGDKAEAIRRTVRGDITPWVPASILQAHPDVTLLLDKAAASGLS